MIWGLLLAIIIAADQLSKIYITSNMQFMESNSLIDKFFYITYYENTGAAWGIFKDARLLFIIVTIIGCLAMFYVFFKSTNKLLKLTLCFICAGAIGNLIDRVVTGRVVDFLDFYIFGYDFPIFNIADSFIVIGSILLIVYMLFIYDDTDSKRKENKNERI